MKNFKIFQHTTSHPFPWLRVTSLCAQCSEETWVYIQCSQSSAPHIPKEFHYSFFHLEQKRDIIPVDNPYHTIPDDYIICLLCNWLLRCFIVQHETSIITASVTMPTPNVTIRSVLSPPVFVVPVTVSACVYREQKRFIRISFSALRY